MGVAGPRQQDRDVPRDLPDGKYRARFYGGNYNSKALAVKAFTLSVNGKKVAEKTVDPKTYYTT